MIVLAGPVLSPIVIDRRRIELAAPEIPRPVQPYHFAQEMELREAENYILQFTREAQDLALQQLSALVKELRANGREVAGCGVVMGSGRPAPSISAALASHPLLHTAEGELFRNALVHASRKIGVSVLGVKEREISQTACRELRLAERTLQERLTRLGRDMGPPWAQDQKLATLAAWLALASREPR